VSHVALSFPILGRACNGMAVSHLNALSIVTAHPSSIPTVLLAA